MGKAKFKVTVRSLCVVAMLVALEIVLNRFASINTQSLKIGFSFIPIALCGMLFGPIWGAIAGGLADFLGAILFPIGPYFPGFTAVAAVMGAVFGLFLYGREKTRFLSVVFVTFINCLICGLLINTYWISLLYDSKSYEGFLVFRLTTQYVFLVPVYLICLPFLGRLVKALRKAGLVEGE